MEKRYRNIDEIITVTEGSLGKKISDFIVKEAAVPYGSKGNIGNIIETGLYGLDNNNKQAPDFENLDIELKVTGYRWVHKGTKVSAKERLVITMIDYFNDIKRGFYDTHLYKKIKRIFLLLYEYENEKSFEEFLITNYYFYEFDKLPDKDRMIIIKDWERIMNKVREGKAHELSEGDTMYLGACTKGADSSSLRSQPFNDELAMSRAYSLKTTYMTALLRSQIFYDVESRESLIKDLNLLKDFTIEEIIEQIFAPYKNKKLSDIDKIIGEKISRKNNKQLMRSYTSKMLKVSEEGYSHIEEFEKANIEVKTITLEANGTLKEHMSFPAMDFVQVAQENWDNSELREFFETTKFLFVVFQKVESTTKLERVFKGAFLWNMPIRIIDSGVRDVWVEMNKVLNSSIEIKVKEGYVYNNFPKQSQHRVSHVRPHGSLRSTTKELPNTTKIKVIENDGSVDLSIYFDNHRYTAMSFWLNKTYLLELIKEAEII